MKTIMSILIISLAMPLTAFASLLPGNVDCDGKSDQGLFADTNHKPARTDSNPDTESGEAE